MIMELADKMLFIWDQDILEVWSEVFAQIALKQSQIDKKGT
jgi:hypothetical protein